MAPTTRHTSRSSYTPTPTPVSALEPTHQDSQEEAPQPEQNADTAFAKITAQEANQFSQIPPSSSPTFKFFGTLGGKGIPLNNSQKRVLLQCCLQSQVTYKRGTKMKYWKSVSLQFEQVASRPYSALSCERAIQKLIERRRLYLQGTSLVGTGNTYFSEGLDDDRELDSLVDEMITIQDEFERSLENPPPPRVSDAGAVAPEGSSASGQEIASNRLKAEQACSSLLISILGRLAKDLCRKQPKIPNHLEYVEESIRQFQQTLNTEMEHWEEISAVMDAILTELRGE